MTSVNFPVGPAAGYSAPTLQLPAATQQIQATFEEGDHLFTSSDFKLGTVCVPHHRALIGRLTFRYSYDAGSKTITVCGTSFPSADGMTMITMPEGMDDEVCFEHAADAGFLADEVYRNGKWNYYSPLTPGAPEKIKEIVRGANDALIAALKELPGHVVQIRQLLPDLSAEDFLALSFVSRNGRRLGGYDPRRGYESGDELHTVFSIFKGTETWPVNYDFANVIGSTPDPRPPPSTSWLALWRSATGKQGPNCASRGFPTTVTCSTGSVGGHVIVGQKAQKVDAGSNDVRIIPICRSHNGKDQSYMKAIDEQEVVILNKYLQTQ